MAEERQERKKINADEEHLVASRCKLLPICNRNSCSHFIIVYRPNLRAKSDADILRDAKLEAMGMPPQDDSPRRPNNERTHMATDELVCFLEVHFTVYSNAIDRSWSVSRNGCENDINFRIVCQYL